MRRLTTGNVNMIMGIITCSKLDDRTRNELLEKMVLMEDEYVNNNNNEGECK